MRLVTRVLSLVATVVVAYAIAIFLYSVADQVSAMPSGPLWDASLRVSLRFILIIIGTIALVIPAFNSDAPAGTRAQAVFATAFFVVYILLKMTKLVDVDYPFHAVAGYVGPLWANFIHQVTSAHT